MSPKRIQRQRTKGWRVPPLPTEAEIADALIQHETSGMCHYGRICGTCDCGRSGLSVEQLAESDAMDRDRARAVLALFGQQPTVAQVKAEAWEEASNATSDAIFSSGDARGVCISWVIPANPYRESEG